MAFDWSSGKAHALTAVMVVILTQGGEYALERYRGEREDDAREEEITVAKADLILQQNASLREDIKQLRTRIDNKEKAFDTMRLRVATLESENIRLKMEVATKTGYPKNNLRLLVQALPVSAWAKEVFFEEGSDLPQFKMLGINNQYELDHCVTDAKYRGKTDFQIYSQDLAQAYYDHDLRVFNDKNDDSFTEKVLDCASGLVVERMFHKYHLQLTDGTDIIGGILISE